jgi:hypothetical protein
MQRLRRRKQLVAMVSTDIYPLRGYFFVLTKRTQMNPQKFGFSLDNFG